jgi:hypothetical protein
MATGKIGLVGLWDAVALDEVADMQKMPKEVVTTLKTYDSLAFYWNKLLLVLCFVNRMVFSHIFSMK